VLVRAALVVAAAAVIVFGATRLHKVDICHDAKNAALAVGLGHPPPGGAAQLSTKIVDNCRDSSDVAAAGAAISRGGDLAVAEHLTRTAVSRDPSAYVAWTALAIVLTRRNKPAASRAAARRAVALNPRYAAARQLAAPARAVAPSGP